MESNRRRFERFSITEEAIAVDSGGRTLGRVTKAGGGGMCIALADLACDFHPGQRMRVTVIEPDPNTQHTIDVLIRYREGNSLGVEFVTGKSATESRKK